MISYENNYQPVASYRPSFPEALLVHSIYKMNSNMKLMEQIILDDNEEMILQIFIIIFDYLYLKNKIVNFASKMAQNHEKIDNFYILCL